MDVMAIPATEDVIVEASSVGSMNELIYVCRPSVVDTKLSVDTYPEEPSPSTVDRREAVDKKPAVLNCLWRSPVVERRERVDTYPDEPSPSTVDLREAVERNPAVLNCLWRSPVVERRLTVDT